MTSIDLTHDGDDKNGKLDNVSTNEFKFANALTSETIVISVYVAD